MSVSAPGGSYEFVVAPELAEVAGPSARHTAGSTGIGTDTTGSSRQLFVAKTVARDQLATLARYSTVIAT